MFGASCRVFTGANAFYKIPLFFGCRRLRNIFLLAAHFTEYRFLRPPPQMFCGGGRLFFAF